MKKSFGSGCISLAMIFGSVSLCTVMNCTVCSAITEEEVEIFINQIKSYDWFIEFEKNYKELKEEFSIIELEISEYKFELELINKKICMIGNKLHRDMLEEIDISDINDIFREKFLNGEMEKLLMKKEKIWGELTGLYDDFCNKVQNFLHEKNFVYGITFPGLLRHISYGSEKCVDYIFEALIPLLKFVASYNPWAI